MKILNLYYSATGNTEKVARHISETLEKEGYRVETRKIAEGMDVELFDYDLVLAGSGVYEWLPGQPVVKAFADLRRKYFQAGKLKPASPRVPGKKAAVYVTYGGYTRA